MKTWLIAGLVASSAFLLTINADAESTYWSASSGSCAAGDPAIQNNRYTIAAGSIRHQSGATGLITLYCNVAPNTGGDTTPNRGWMTYKTDGTGSINAWLYKKSTTTGSITSLFEIDSIDTDGVVTVTHQDPVAFTIDFNSYFYYMRVDIDRSSSGATDVASFYGVRFGDS